MLNNQLKYNFRKVTSGMRQTSRREEDNILCVNKTKMCQTLNWRASGSVKYIFKQKILCLFSLSFHVYQKLLHWVPKLKTWQCIPGGGCVVPLFGVGEKEMTSLLSHIAEFHKLWYYVIFLYNHSWCVMESKCFCSLFSLIVSWLLIGNLEIHYGEIRLYQHQSNCSSYFPS